RPPGAMVVAAFRLSMDSPRGRPRDDFIARDGSDGRSAADRRRPQFDLPGHRQGEARRLVPGSAYSSFRRVAVNVAGPLNSTLPSGSVSVALALPVKVSPSTVMV